MLHLLFNTHTCTQSPLSLPPQPTASDNDSDSIYSVPEEEEPEEQYSTSPFPPIRPDDLTSTDESGSLCRTVESPVRLEPQELGKSERG